MGSVSDVTPFFRILKNKNTRGKMLFSEKLDTTACKYTEINTSEGVFKLYKTEELEANDPKQKNSPLMYFFYLFTF